jgi:predicted TIM-barrel fold metal-dependent hydrolase
LNEFLQNIPVVDAHHHLWDLGASTYPWLGERPNTGFFLGDYSALRKNYLPADYRRDSLGHNVKLSVHIEAEWHRDGQIDETRWVNQMADETGTPGAIVAHAWFDDDNVEGILERQASFPRVRGIRSKPARPGQDSGGDDEARGAMSNPAWRRGFALLSKYDLSWDLRVPLEQLEEAARLAGDFPETAIVLNHAGFPWDRSEEGLAWWRKSMALLAERPNVMVKLSEFGLRNAPWDFDSNRAIVLEAIDLFGADRCMFASNFPVAGLRIGYTELYNAYKRMVADFSEAEQLMLFHNCAVRFYKPVGYPLA